MISNLSHFRSSLGWHISGAASSVKSLCASEATFLGINYQQSRDKSKIHFCGYLEPPAHKKRDLRYKTATKHDTRRMTWTDYQVRRWRAVHWQKPYPLWQAQMDYAENLCRLGMPAWTIEKITGIHPHCIQFINRKLSGNIELLREAEYSNYVNHKTGER